MNTDTYNGYTNKETWLVRLWLDNDEYSQEYVLQGVMDSYRTDVPSATLANYLRNMVETANPETEASLYADLIRCVLHRINFRELADSYINDYANEVLA